MWQTRNLFESLVLHVKIKNYPLQPPENKNKIRVFIHIYSRTATQKLGTCAHRNFPKNDMFQLVEFFQICCRDRDEWNPQKHLQTFEFGISSRVSLFKTSSQPPRATLSPLPQVVRLISSSQLKQLVTWYIRRQQEPWNCRFYCGSSTTFIYLV